MDIIPSGGDMFKIFEKANINVRELNRIRHYQLF